MSDESVAQVANQTADGAQGKRERSRIVFPYNDLKDATAVAVAVWDHVGAGTCDIAQLAAWLKHDSVNSGAFRLKVAATKTFGLITSKQGEISLTKLGREIVDPQKAANAKVSAFLNVPLYSELYGKYTGILLPNAVGLEREIADLGVAPKQTDKARQAFQRSAQEAGFFTEGNNKLVRPATATDDSRPTDAPERGGGGGGGGQNHPLVQLLVNSLPDPGSAWPKGERQKWVKLAEAAFDVVYLDDPKASAPTERPQPSGQSPDAAQD